MRAASPMSSSSSGQRSPVPNAGDLPIRALAGRRSMQSRKAFQRNADFASILEKDVQPSLGEADALSESRFDHPSTSRRSHATCRGSRHDGRPRSGEPPATDAECYTRLLASSSGVSRKLGSATVAFDLDVWRFAAIRPAEPKGVALLHWYRGQREPSRLFWKLVRL